MGHITSTIDRLLPAVKQRTARQAGEDGGAAALSQSWSADQSSNWIGMIFIPAASSELLR